LFYINSFNLNVAIHCTMQLKGGRDKCPARAYPLHDFHEIAEFVPRFRVALAVIIWLVLLNGLQSSGGLSWGCRLLPKFQRPLAGKLHRTPKSYRGARTCSTSSVAKQSLVGLGFQAPPGWTKMLSLLSVCLFVCSSRCWTSEFGRPISPWMRWSTETISMPLNRGICVCICVQLWRSQKTSRSQLCKILVSWQKSDISVS